jgi:hypothetical protein
MTEYFFSVTYMLRGASVMFHAQENICCNSMTQNDLNSGMVEIKNGGSFQEKLVEEVIVAVCQPTLSLSSDMLSLQMFIKAHLNGSFMFYVSYIPMSIHSLTCNQARRSFQPI